jgi:peptidoglycan/LPS O-acetylase OafA/YrhL
MQTRKLEDRFHALDGLRGLAAIGVLFNHLGPTTGDWWLVPVVWFGAVGWVGVDLFFVLSGFLITGILIDNKSATNYFRAFYTHRALRILPVYVLLLLIWTIIIPWLAPEYLKSVSAPGSSISAWHG